MFKNMRQLPKLFPFKSLSIFHKFRVRVWRSLITYKSACINCFEMFVQFHPKTWLYVCVSIVSSRILGNSHMRRVRGTGWV